MTRDKKKRGRPRSELSAEQRARIEAMACSQCKDCNIAKALGLDPVTFKRNFEAVTTQKGAEGTAEILDSQFRLAIEKAQSDHADLVGQTTSGTN